MHLLAEEYLRSAELLDQRIRQLRSSGECSAFFSSQ